MHATTIPKYLNLPCPLAQYGTRHCLGDSVTPPVYQSHFACLLLSQHRYRFADVFAAKENYDFGRDGKAAWAVQKTAALFIVRKFHRRRVTPEAADRHVQAETIHALSLIHI